MGINSTANSDGALINCLRKLGAGFRQLPVPPGRYGYFHYIVHFRQLLKELTITEKAMQQTQTDESIPLVLKTLFK